MAEPNRVVEASVISPTRTSHLAEKSRKLCSESLHVEKYGSDSQEKDVRSSIILG